MTTIYVMAHDGGCEGHSPPTQAFATYADARACMALAEQAGAIGMVVYEVPLWPATDGTPYFSGRKSVLPERNGP